MNAARIAGAVVVLGAAAMFVAVALRQARTAPPPVSAAPAVTELLARGDRLASVGRPYRAVEYYLRAQHVAPDDPETWRRLANAALAAFKRRLIRHNAVRFPARRTDGERGLGAAPRSRRSLWPAAPLF